MPIPQPRPTETREQFINRCVSDNTMVEEYPNNAQRFAICSSVWREKGDENARSSKSS